MLFSYLDTVKQRILHAFYLPSRQLTKQQLAGHLEQVMKTNPDLVQRAGIYQAALEKLFLDFSKVRGVTTLQAGQVIETVYKEHKKRAGGRVLHPPTSIAAELRGKPVRIVARATVLPVADYESMRRTAIDYSKLGVSD
jgi:hypothetical protein